MAFYLDFRFTTAVFDNVQAVALLHASSRSGTQPKEAAPVWGMPFSLQMEKRAGVKDTMALKPSAPT